MPPLIILKTGSSLPDIIERRGDFEGWIAAGMGIELASMRVIDVYREHLPPEPEDVGAVVVTGSAAMVTARAKWSVESGRWLERVILTERPVLGICYGHQLIADQLGGVVGKNPNGREIGTIEVTLTEDGQSDPLLGALPPAPRFQSTHVESVVELPPGARRLATSALDPNQAYRIGKQAWGVQFHPECDAQIIRGYVAARRHVIERDGIDPDAVMTNASDSPHGHALLRRFAEIAGLVKT